MAMAPKQYLHESWELLVNCGRKFVIEIFEIISICVSYIDRKEEYREACDTCSLDDVSNSEGILSMRAYDFVPRL